MPKPQGECPFCGTAIPKIRGCICPGCQTAFPEDLVGSKSSDALDRAFHIISRDEESDEYQEGRLVLRQLEVEEEEEIEQSVLAGLSETPDSDGDDVKSEIGAIFRAEQRKKPHVDEADRAAVAQAKIDRQWDAIAEKAQALVKRQPWTLHEGGGHCFLKRWVDRTQDLQRISPPHSEPPRVPPVFSQVGTLRGEPFIVPIRRKAELQQILDEQNAGFQLADLTRSRSRRGRRHRKEERKQIPEWEQDREKIILTKALLKAKYPRGGVDKNDPDAMGYAALRIKWQGSKKCPRENCQNFIPRSFRQTYCSSACKHRAKKVRRKS